MIKTMSLILLQEVSADLQRRLDDATQSSHQQGTEWSCRQEEWERKVQEMHSHLHESSSERQQIIAENAKIKQELNASEKQRIQQRQDWETQQEQLQVHYSPFEYYDIRLEKE